MPGAGGCVVADEADVGEVGADVDHVAEVRVVRGEDGAEDLEYAVGLAGHVVLAGQLAVSVERELAGDDEQRPYPWRALFRELPADSEVAAAHARVMERAGRGIAGLFALSPRWRTTASISSEHTIEALAIMVRSAINGLAEWWWENREVPREDIVGLAVDLLWPGIERLSEQ